MTFIEILEFQYYMTVPATTSTVIFLLSFLFSWCTRCSTSLSLISMLFSTNLVFAGALSYSFQFVNFISLTYPLLDFPSFLLYPSFTGFHSMIFWIASFMQAPNSSSVGCLSVFLMYIPIALFITYWQIITISSTTIINAYTIFISLLPFLLISHHFCSILSLQAPARAE